MKAFKVPMLVTGGESYPPFDKVSTSDWTDVGIRQCHVRVDKSLVGV